MSTPNPAEVIAEALAEHRISEAQLWDRVRHSYRNRCVCGAVVDYDMAAHQASVIAALPDIAIVRAFIRERQEYVDAARATVETNADYFRWQGHMEARRQLAQKLGLPYEFESAGGES